MLLTDLLVKRLDIDATNVLLFHLYLCTILFLSFLDMDMTCEQLVYCVVHDLLIYDLKVSAKLSELKTTIDIGQLHRGNLLQTIGYDFEKWNLLVSLWFEALTSLAFLVPDGYPSYFFVLISNKCFRYYRSIMFKFN